MIALRHYPRPLLRILADTVAAYFYPLTRRFRSNLRIERLYRIGGGEREFRASAYRFTGEIASFNQGALVEYLFSVAELHKELRLSIEAQADVAPTRAALIERMNDGFFSSVYQNFQFLHQHFEGRATSQPHISVRGNWRTAKHDEVITIFRDREVEGDGPFNINESTPISYCAANGAPYLCNDIPREVVNRNFHSPRFNLELANRELGKSHFPFRRTNLDRNWSRFWKSANGDESFAYRSNLTIPISILRSQLSDGAAKSFKIGNSEILIFGYLCFDHKDAGFFDAEIDIPIAKMVADIISIFSFQRLRFTNFSSTFNKSDGQADSIDEIDEKQFIKHIFDLMKNRQMKPIFENAPDIQSVELVSADSNLFVFGSEEVKR